MNKNKKDKKAVSLLISYVILIGIVLALSIGIFIWLKDLANFQPVVSCKDGSSINVEDYSCDGHSITLNIRNNGRFSINGFILRVGDDEERTPITYLHVQQSPNVQLTIPGNAGFVTPLKPSENINVTFSNQETVNGVVKKVDYRFIKIGQIQPFIIENKEKIICENSIIKQKIENCVINSDLVG